MEDRVKLNARIILQVSCLGRPGETVAILTDREESRLQHSAWLAETAKELGMLPLILDVSEYDQMTKEVKDSEIRMFEAVTAALEASDIAIRIGGPAPPYFLKNTPPGKRPRTFKLMYTDPGMDKWEISAEEVGAIRMRMEWLIEKMTVSKELRITSPAGTDITFDVSRDTNWLPIYSFIPFFGELAVSPRRGAGNGVYVIDGTTQKKVRPGDELDRDPLKIEVENGKVVNVHGDPEQIERLMKYIQDGNPPAEYIDEIGIVVTKIKANDEFWGEGAHTHDSIHIALGNNMLRKTHVHGIQHMDGDMKKPTVELDGLAFIVKGEFQDKMLGK